MTKGVLRFFFEYGAGGCLWAGDDATRDTLGYGPVDAEFRSLDGHVRAARLPLSIEARNLQEQLDFEHSGYLNPLSPPDPSLWSQSLCDRFNARVDQLLALLRRELGERYIIVDQQERYVEDSGLDAYLLKNPTLVKLNEVVAPTVR
jgi:hypothetical protein